MISLTTSKNKAYLTTNSLCLELISIKITQDCKNFSLYNNDTSSIDLNILVVLFHTWHVI